MHADAPTPEVSKGRLIGWSTPLDTIRYLSNQEVRQAGGSLLLSLQNLESLEVHTFAFASPLGYRFAVAHNMRRMGSTFTVENSEWLKEHSLAPLRTTRLDGAVHYVFCSSDGEFEVLAIGPPLYSVSTSPSVSPRGASKRSRNQDAG